MSIRSPLGATPDSGAYELRAPSLRTATVPARARSRASARARSGQLGLGGLLVAGVLITLAAPNTDSLLPESVRPIPSWLAGPFGHAGIGLGVAPLIGLLALMFASYDLAARAADRLSGRAVLMTIAALHALVLLAPPLLSTDVFSYQVYARMGALYGANPFLHGPGAIALDPLYPFIGSKWVGTPTAYGPIFTVLSYATAELSIAASVVVYKAVAAISSLAVVALVWNAARLRGLDPVKAAALVGLNPLTVLYAVGGGHNDLLMLAVVTAGVYLMLAHRERAGAASLVIALGIKLTGGLYAAFALADGERPRRRERRRDVALGAAIAAVFVAGVGVAAFGSAPLHMLATVQYGQSKGDWHSLAGFVSTTLGLPTLGRIVRVALAAVFALVVAWLLRRVWRGDLDWIDGAGWATAVLLVTASALFPWYVSWLLPFAALASDRRLWRVAIVMTGIVQLIQVLGYIPHGSGF